MKFVKNLLSSVYFYEFKKFLKNNVKDEEWGTQKPEFRVKWRSYLIVVRFLKYTFC